MVAHLSDSMIFGPRPYGLRMIALVAVMALSGCSNKQVIVTGNFPTPTMTKVQTTLGVVYSPEFANHEFFDEAKGRNESSWLVQTGTAQVEFWNTFLPGMFERVVVIGSDEDWHTHHESLDAVLIPQVAELQYAIPLHTNVKVYEIWLRYQFRLVTPEAIHAHEAESLMFNPAEDIASFTLTAYGKTPSAFMQSDTDAVNYAAIVALRDAGANFITQFERIPAVATWLLALGEDTPGEAP